MMAKVDKNLTRAFFSKISPEHPWAYKLFLKLRKMHIIFNTCLFITDKSNHYLQQIKLQ